VTYKLFQFLKLCDNEMRCPLGGGGDNEMRCPLGGGGDKEKKQKKLFALGEWGELLRGVQRGTCV